MAHEEKSDAQLPVVGGANDGDMAAANSNYGAATADPTNVTPDEVYEVRSLQVHGKVVRAFVLVGLPEEEVLRRYLARRG